MAKESLEAYTFDSVDKAGFLGLKYTASERLLCQISLARKLDSFLSLANSSFLLGELLSDLSLQVKELTPGLQRQRLNSVVKETDFPDDLGNCIRNYPDFVEIIIPEGVPDLFSRILRRMALTLSGRDTRIRNSLPRRFDPRDIEILTLFDIVQDITNEIDLCLRSNAPQHWTYELQAKMAKEFEAQFRKCVDYRHRIATLSGKIRKIESQRTKERQKMKAVHAQLKSFLSNPNKSADIRTNLELFLHALDNFDVEETALNSKIDRHECDKSFTESSWSVESILHDIWEESLISACRRVGYQLDWFLVSAIHGGMKL
jgi:hypothetical protein